MRVLSGEMKNTGMHRKVDDLGRIVLPAELRRSLGLKEGSKLDISVEEDRIVLSPRQETCVFCESRSDLKDFKGRGVCSGCWNEINGGAAAQTTEAGWEPFSG
ncbi:MAG: AbrB/MazE/SpoVT family DNA-binding domain-containing protein [Actinomycetota bacterium]